MLIALSLVAILLTFLFSFFVESAKIETKLDRARMAVTARGHLQTRLQSVLSAVTHDSLAAPLYTQSFDKEKQPSLVAVFDNGIDPDPAFSGAILGRLFLDEEKNLILATWPLDKAPRRPWRKEILLRHVESFAFEFLGPNNAPKEEKSRSITPSLAWRTAWPKSNARVPSIIRLHLQQEKSKEELRFAFLLPRPDDFVSYAGGTL
jgi:hypothetical protein